MFRSLILLAASIVFLPASASPAAANGRSWRGWAGSVRTSGFAFSVGRPYHHGHSYAYYGGYYPRTSYRPYVYYRPIYTDYCYAPPVYTYAAPVYNYAPPVYSSYLPITAELSTFPPPPLKTIGRPRIEVIDPSRFSLPSLGDGTFRYDGGPAIPVPLPNEAKSSNASESRVASAAKQHRYLAYGEKAEKAPRDIARVPEPFLGEAGSGFSGDTMIFTQARR